MPAALGWCLFDTAIGACGLAWGEATVVGAQLPEASPALTRARMQRRFAGVGEGPPPAWVEQVIARSQAVLGGSRDTLEDVPLDLAGVTVFHQRVYALARAIAPGEVRTYGELAQAMGDTRLSRAVGQALGANPFAPIVPCHRVVAAGGRSGGFSARGGALTKLRLLELERARLGVGGQPGLFD